MIQHPDMSMVNELKKLWIECFPGDEEYCEMFFNEYFTVDRCLIVKNSSAIESALYTFDAITHTDDSDIPSLYLYAISTFAKYRGIGNAGKLIEYVKKYCADNKINCIYLKAADTINGFYEKFGFKDTFYLNRYICLPSDDEYKLKFENCLFDDFQKMRNEYLSLLKYSIIWPPDTLTFMYKEICSYGEIIKFSIDSHDYYAVISMPDDMLIIRESNLPPEYYQHLINCVASYFNWEKELIIHSSYNLVPYLKNIISADKKYIGHSYLVLNSANILQHYYYINLVAE